MTPVSQYTFNFDVREALERDDLVVGCGQCGGRAMGGPVADLASTGLVLIGPPGPEIASRRRVVLARARRVT